MFALLCKIRKKKKIKQNKINLKNDTISSNLIFIQKRKKNLPFINFLSFKHFSSFFFKNKHRVNHFQYISLQSCLPPYFSMNINIILIFGLFRLLSIIRFKVCSVGTDDLEFSEHIQVSCIKRSGASSKQSLPPFHVYVMSRDFYDTFTTETLNQQRKLKGKTSSPAVGGQLILFK